LKLSRYASARIAVLGRLAGGRNADDLLQDALLATVRGQRHRYKARVGLIGHLIGAIRSIASAWAAKFHADTAYLESEVTTSDEEGDPVSPVSRIADPAPNVDRSILAQREIETIRLLFKDDVNVTHVIDGLRDELTAKEIQDRYGMSEQDCNSAFKRMRRLVRSERKSQRLSGSTV
jgi:hypothetical protein